MSTTLNIFHTLNGLYQILDKFSFTSWNLKVGSNASFSLSLSNIMMFLLLCFEKHVCMYIYGSNENLTTAMGIEERVAS